MIWSIYFSRKVLKITNKLYNVYRDRYVIFILDFYLTDRMIKHSIENFLKELQCFGATCQEMSRTDIYTSTVCQSLYT